MKVRLDLCHSEGRRIMHGESGGRSPQESAGFWGILRVPLDWAGFIMSVGIFIRCHLMGPFFAYYCRSSLELPSN